MWCRDRRSILRLVLVLLIPAVIGPPAEARAAQRVIDMGMTVRQEYSDNLFLTESEKEDDALTTVSPSIRLTYRTERTRAGAHARVGALVYAGNSDLNAVDQDYRVEASHQVSPRLGISADAGYIRDHRPDRDVETTGLVYTAVTRERLEGGFSSRYMLSELTAIDLSYRMYEDEYKSPGYTDTLSQSVTLGAVHDLGRYVEGLAARLTLGYDRYDYPQSRYDNYWLTLGGAYRFNEKWDVLLDLGGRHTRSEAEVLTFVPLLAPALSSRVILVRNPWQLETLTSDSTGGTGRMTVGYQGEFDRLEFGASQGLFAASGQGESSNRTTLTLSYRRRFSESFGAALFAGYYINRTDRGNSGFEEEEENTFRITPSLWYEIARDLRLSAGYQYTDIDDETSRRNRNLFYVLLGFEHDWGN